ncbi:MAG: DUF917 domain-containing protein [Clostridiales bacterium]|nr:DUF917 domain-containing protein [Clostridiales bacterium]
MSKVLYKEDIEQVLIGATFLGAGGGGSLHFGVKMLNQLEEAGEDIQLELLDVGEIADKDLYGAMVAGLGSPVKIIEGAFGPDAVAAFKAFQKAFAAEGKEVKYLYSGEFGGFNTFVPMMVAILSDKDPARRVRFLDVDGNGRAVPELNTSLNSARGFPPYPIGLGTALEDMIIAYPTTDKSAETIARQLCMAYGMKIGFSTWGMSVKELEGNAVVGAVSLCLETGKAIRMAKEAGRSPFEAICEQMPALEMKRAIRGKITDIRTETKDGFDVGSTMVKDDATQETFTIDFQNENLLIRDAAGKVYITVPELISIVTTEKNTVGEICAPLTNADTEVGMEVEIVVSPAHPYWWAEDKKANECWASVLERVDYSGAMIEYPGLY